MFTLFSRKIHALSLPLVVIVCMVVFSSQAEARGMMGKSIFNGAPSTDQCQKCHGDGENFPHPLLQEPNMNKHHFRIGTPIEGLANGRHDSVAPGDISSGEYGCLSCHGVDGKFVATVVRDCLNCHLASSVTGHPRRGSNVHHSTDAFYKRDCSACHGFLSADVSSNSDSLNQESSWSSHRMGGRR
jgi:mono/diheme cytochrome c family protein